MTCVYVTGHRNPDTDSIPAAVGNAELKGRLDPRDEYRPMRLGEVNEQTRWVLDRAGAEDPEFLPQVGRHRMRVATRGRAFIRTVDLTGCGAAASP